MTIRYTCPECSSVLKIKDDLAGTGARCPKCKRKFVVPTTSQEDSAQITVEVDSDEHPARSHDNRKTLQKPSHDASLSSTEMTTISDDAPSSDAVAQVPNRPRKRSAGDESDSSHSALPVAGNRKPLTDEFRTSGTVADTMHYHLEDDDSDATPASDTVEQNPNRPAKRSADDESDISDSSLPVAGTHKSLTNEIRTSPTVADSPHFHLEDDESEDSREIVSTNQNGASVNYHVDDDDDDLDSPAILVSIPIPDADSSLSSPTKKPKSSSFTPAFEAPQASDSAFDLSTKKTVPQAFDPAKFLIEDEKPKSRPAPKSYLEDDDSDLGLSDDSGYDVLNPPTPQPPRRPSAPLATSRPAPEKVDLAAAAKMMKKAIKDAQSDATRVRQREANPGFDYGLFFREIGFRGLALIVGLAVMVFVCIQVGSYVFNSRLKTPPLARVTGHVTLDGQPLSNATVYFRPLDTTITKGRRDQARTSIGVTDEKGYFEMMYSPADRIRGVNVGTCFYWVDHVGDKGNDVPPNWMEFAQNTFDVKAGGNSDADIKMTSAKR